MSNHESAVQESGLEEFKDVHLRDDLSFMVGVKDGVAYVLVRRYESPDNPEGLGKRAVMLEVRLDDLPESGEGEILPFVKVDVSGAERYSE